MRMFVYISLFIILSGCYSRSYEMAFATNRDNNMDICLTNSQNGILSNLTHSDITEYNLTWTVDGKEIFYTSYDTSGRKVKSIEVATKIVKTIIQDSTILSVSDVSNDKTHLIISTNEHHKKGELYLYNMATQAKARLTNNEFYEAGAKFAPDEKYIVASIQTKASDSTDHAGIAEIFKINSSNLNTEQLTDIKGFNGLPDFSPKGNLIAFHRCSKGNCDIYTMNVDGSNLRNLTKGKDDNRWPRWSPDGRWIAFTKTINGNSDIYFVSKDGNITKPVITTKFRDEIAIFKP